MIRCIMDQPVEPAAERGQPYPELFIGLVAAIGTDHDQLCQILDETLRSFGYRSKMVRLASLLRTIPRFKKLKTEPIDKYISDHQDAGNKFRELIENANAMAAFGIGEIRQCRKAETGDRETIANRCAYIIRSLKTPEEVQLLRHVYSGAFFLLAS